MQTLKQAADICPPPRPNGGYAIVPSVVLRDPDLTRDARLLFAILDGRQGAAGSVRVLLATLAADLDASERSVRRWLDELRDAGLVATTVTGRSLLVRVGNAARRSTAAPRPDTRGRRDRTPVAALQSIKSGGLSTSPAPTIQEHQGARSAPDDGRSAGTYLAAIETATGHRLRATTAVREHLAAIHRQGLTPDQTATLVSAYLATRAGRLTNPTGFIASIVLADLANGTRPRQEPQRPTPPPFRDLESADPCAHGEPAGPSRCALCRRVAA